MAPSTGGAEVSEPAVVAVTLFMLLFRGQSERVHALESEYRSEHRPQLPHLLAAMKAHQLVGDGPWRPRHQRLRVPGQQRRPTEHERALRHLVAGAELLPEQ